MQSAILQNLFHATAQPPEAHREMSGHQEANHPEEMLRCCWVASAAPSEMSPSVLWCRLSDAEGFAPDMEGGKSTRDGGHKKGAWCTTEAEIMMIWEATDEATQMVWMTTGDATQW